MWYVVSIGAFLALQLAAWPWIVERRRPSIGPKERHRALGEFAQLSQGVTHYRWVGPARGPVAVVIHGLATPMIAMDSVAKVLGDLGYRVLMYDLYGRGLSDAPKGPQKRAFFLRQLSDLLAYHNLREDLSIVGYSMGGGIATAFASENPHCIKRVILFACSGVLTLESDFAKFCRTVPLLGDWWHGMFVYGRIARAIPEKGQSKEIDLVVRAQRRELNRRGYLPAILSSRRGMLSENHEQEHRQLGRQGIPVIAIWAGADQVIPLSAVGLLAQWNRNARQEVVDHADHALPYTHGTQMIAALKSALRD